MESNLIPKMFCDWRFTAGKDSTEARAYHTYVHHAHVHRAYMYSITEREMRVDYIRQLNTHRSYPELSEDMLASHVILPACPSLRQELPDHLRFHRLHEKSKGSLFTHPKFLDIRAISILRATD
ncbi:PREDICTED: uncharacterized protein LOC108776330 isoform X1 [Cyphomyrmex costatus]|uniref:uncharacterized protein LOC108776330 isoform X1 n=1 Tax=Cyphomyrmex costatus TaxID=456900 RepID=UPI0008522CB0|nr:PREDICTED: uncharacterized protein LOC108776330 isoform X1 [Cyphomyrmex costatus]